VRTPIGQQMVERGRRLGAYMRGDSLTGNHDEDARAVMHETAIDLDP
jgi:hypothetical protein